MSAPTPGAVADANAAIADHIRSLYATYGDRAAFDRHLDPDVTVWESDASALMRGLQELDELRDRRAAGRDDSSVSVSLATQLLRVDASGDAGLACYLLSGRRDGQPDLLFRVTDVLRRDQAGWRIVHHHSELVTS